MRPTDPWYKENLSTAELKARMRAEFQRFRDAGNDVAAADTADDFLELFGEEIE